MSLHNIAGHSSTEELTGGAAASAGPILPPKTETQPEEGFALREWRRKNAIRLEEKEAQEKESVKEIIAAADQYKAEFERTWKARCNTNTTINKEKEKSYLESREKFHAEADKNYFKAIAEIIPKEVPKLEKRGKKAEEKSASVVVIQGPKLGKPTDLSRMRQVLVNLKYNPPTHMKLEKDIKTSLMPPTK